MERVKYIINLVIVVLLLFSVAIVKDGRVAGVDINEFTTKASETVEEVPVATDSGNGVTVINTTSIGKDIIGYAGTTPLKIYIKGDVIQSVEFLPNDETPGFFRRLERKNLAKFWEGKTLSEALSSAPDVVTGATMSYDAVVQNVKRGASYASNTAEKVSNPFSNIELKEIIGLLVILLGAVITLKRVKSKRLLIAQMVLNVAVLGFWCGSFLSMSLFTSWASNGINLSMSLVTLSMLAIVVVMPLLKRKGSYCHIHCPMGSAQELMGLIPVKKLHIKPSITKVLNSLRYYILLALLFVMWLGVGFEIMDYEIFPAFIVSSASTVILVMAAILLLLSIFIPRPYCRFICPTGALITMSQKTKE